MCCLKWQFEKVHYKEQIIEQLIWKSLLRFCWRRRLHFGIYKPILT